MKYLPYILSLVAASIFPSYAAVSVLPSAPEGYRWEKINSSPIENRASFNTSDVSDQARIELKISSTTAVGEEATTNTSQTIRVPSFGVPEPVIYQLGSVVQVVEVNDFSAAFGVCSIGAAYNPNQDLVLLTNIVSDLQISGPAGSSPIAAGHQSALETGQTILIEENVHPIQSYVTSLSQIQGEMVDFTFAANAALRAETPIAEAGVEAVTYFTSPVVESVLTRLTVYNEFRLVEVPEPSGSLLLLTSSCLLFFRRRR